MHFLNSKTQLSTMSKNPNKSTNYESCIICHDSVQKTLAEKSTFLAKLSVCNNRFHVIHNSKVFIRKLLKKCSSKFKLSTTFL